MRRTSAPISSSASSPTISGTPLAAPHSIPHSTSYFPGGIANYTTGANEEQPDRMDLLANLLEMNLISKLDPATLTDVVKRVRDESTAYRKVVDSFAQPRIELQQLQRAKTAIAHSAQMELANLKRLYKAQGFSEADIHSVIPDRPRPKKTPVAPPSPTPAGPTQSAPSPTV